MRIMPETAWAWKLERNTITFGSVARNTVVGTVEDVGNISHAYGMVLLGSGSTPLHDVICGLAKPHIQSIESN